MKELILTNKDEIKIQVKKFVISYNDIALTSVNTVAKLEWYSRLFLNSVEQFNGSLFNVSTKTYLKRPKTV